MLKKRWRFTSRKTFWHWDGLRITFASGCMATARISTSTGTSIQRTFVWHIAAYALSAVRKMLRAPTRWRWRRRGSRPLPGYSEAVTEFHIVGGLHPDLPFEYFLDLVSGLKQRFPQVHLKAFTMVEVAFLAKRAKLSIRETLQKLKAAGVDSLPGGGAEIFAERVRHIICDHKIDGSQWIETARIAHELGLKSNATMLYGHIENDEDRVDHLMRLRALQDDTHGFQTFIPLAFHPDNTPLSHLPWTTGFDDIKQIAVSRLVLDNFPHIKSYWQMMTPKIAQISLRFGADDIDGTVVEEKIYHDAGAETPQGLRRKDLVRLITEAGREPIERDTLYRPVTRTETTFTISV